MKHVTAAIVLMAITALAHADDSAFVPFVIPQVMSEKSEINLTGAPIKTDSPHLVAKGHFFAGDSRFKVWGVNFCFGANFPEHKDAERIAKRMAMLGINSVRFHHMDMQTFPNGIWDQDFKNLSPDALDRLDYFIDQLAKNGIYANINLHVSASHSRRLNLPQHEQLKDFDKVVDMFTPELIEAQKQYARDLLTHVNAYRKVRYADDPAVAFVEINNETSFFMWNFPQRIMEFPPHYQTLLQERFAKYLQTKYGGTERLAEAWNREAKPLGKNMLADVNTRAGEGAKWVLEQHGEAKAEVRDLARKGGAETPNAISIVVSKGDGTDWHVMYNHGGLKVKKGEYYTLTFRAMADKPRMVRATLGQAHDPWGNLGLTRLVKLTADWQTFTYGVTATADDDNARVSFSFGEAEPTVQLENVVFAPGGQVGLAKGQSVEQFNIPVFADCETTARVHDRMEFFAKLEKGYYDDMRKFLKDELKLKALVTGTCVFGPLGLYAQSDMDYIDGHAYWQHPHFPRKAWDPNDWTVGQEAMVDHMEKAVLIGLAVNRLAGKPYTVSEYNHAAPNDWQAECVPMLATFAAQQDWDGVWLFAYSHDAKWDAEHYTSFFDIKANPAKLGFWPAGALMFARAAVPPVCNGRVVSLCKAPDEDKGDLIAAHLRSDIIFLAMAGPAKLEQASVVAIQYAATLKGDGNIRSESPDRWHIEWKSQPGASRFSYEGGSASVVVNGPDKEGNGFLAVTATPLDGRTLAESKKVLITACSRCVNTDMKFTPDRSSVGANWGKPPVLIEAPTKKFHLALPTEGVSWTFHALSPDGSLGAELAKPTIDKDGKLTVELSPAAKTMWYLLRR